MTQVTTHTPTHSNREIIKTVTEVEWREAGYSGEPTIPSLEQIQAFTAEAPDKGWVVFVLERPKATRYDVHSIDEDTKRLELSQRIMSQPEAETPEAQIWTMTNILHREAIAEYLRQDFYEVDPAHFEPMANFMKRTAGEPAPERLQWIHKAWEKADDDNPELEIPHPLSTIIRALLLREQTSKRITATHDKIRPASIIKNPMGSVREINFTDSGDAQLREFATPERISQVNPDQMRLGFNDEPPSILPDFMPLEVPNPEGLKPTTKGGAVSHVVRILYESIMALEPHEWASDIAFRLGDLIKYLNPDGKFHRANQLPYIINALETLHNDATLPWIDDTGEMRKWRPVWVKTPLSMDSKNDAPVHMRVEMPPDAQQGYMILKHIHRLLGKKSGPQFNAYHTISWIWDKHATVLGKLIDPTRPIDRRNEKGEIVGADGKPILTARGKPITNLYHDKVIAQGEREDNPAADRYPVLSRNDLIAACMPKATDTNPRRLWEKAKAYWEGMEAEGIIRIKRERTGWRIFPSQEHLAAYRGVSASSQKKV